MENLNKEITILVNSCDLYEDAWDPFFKLLYIQWPHCSHYNIVLNTETKTYNCKFLDVKTICSPMAKTWSERLEFCVNSINTKYILFFLEDYFLLSPVNNDSFEEAYELMRNDNNIGYVGLKYNRVLRYKNTESECLMERFISRDELQGGKRVNCNTALWRKDWLLKLIRRHETPWEFEQYAEIRSRRTGKKALQINNNLLKPVFEYEMLFEYGYGISLKKWLPKNKELFEKYGIEVNFNNLGIMDNATYVAMLNYGDSKKKVKNHETSVRETLYIIKKNIKKTPNRIKKLKRKIMSII